MPSYRDLGFDSYDAYLRSPHWKSRRFRFAHTHPRRCAVCDTHVGCQLHHKTYERVGAELDEDLEWLCALHHEAVHEGGRVMVPSAGASKHLRAQLFGTPGPAPDKWLKWARDRAVNMMGMQRGVVVRMSRGQLKRAMRKWQSTRDKNKHHKNQRKIEKPEHRKLREPIKPTDPAGRILKKTDDVILKSEWMIED